MNKLFMVNATFVVGEYEQNFTMTTSAQDQEEADKKVTDYFKDYYGEEHLVEHDESSFTYNGGEVMVKVRGVHEVTIQELASRLNKI